jgi:hypothetical protein
MSEMAMFHLLIQPYEHFSLAKSSGALLMADWLVQEPPRDEA